MAKPVIMPRLGQSVESCIIAGWQKKKGDKVHKGDILLSYETDKASFDLEAEDEGVLLETFYNEGDEVPVLANIAVIGNPGEPVDEFRPGGAVVQKEEKAEKTQSSQPAIQEDASVLMTRESEGVIKISPRAKNLAEKLSVYYNNLAGSGPDGRIIEKDIQAAAAAGARLTSTSAGMIRQEGYKPPVSGTGIGGRVTEKDILDQNRGEGDFKDVKLSNVRKLIAKGMFNSLQNSAQLTHHMSADARNILALREDVKNSLIEGKKIENITLNDMVCFAVIKALKKTPDANAHFLGDSIRLFSSVHLGFAVDTERGLLVPAVRDAGNYSLTQLATKLKEMANKAKTGSIEPELISPVAATFTVSNLGAYGVELFTPVINLPQVGILGVNTIILRPAELGNGVFGFVPYIGLSLTYDHRAIDGGPASMFLKTIKTEIENFPSSLSQIL